MSENSSKTTPIYIQHLFSNSHTKELREIKIQDRDITYSIKWGSNGLEMVRAKKGNEICAQLTTEKPEGKEKLQTESSYTRKHTENGHIELNTGSDGRVDSILMFVQGEDKTVDGALSFDLTQQSLGVWSDSRWADLRLTPNGLQYVHYYTPEDAELKRTSILSKAPDKVSVVIDGQEVSPVQVQKNPTPRQAQPASSGKAANNKEVEFLSIVAQLSEPKRNELLNKWQAEALQALAAEK